MHDVVDSYLDTWNETDPAARRELLERHWAAGATYTDPMAEVSGLEAIDALIAAAQARFTGLVFAADGTADAHHRQVRFRWTLGPPGGQAPIAGSDVIVVDDHGRIAAVLGFLDRVPAAA